MFQYTCTTGMDLAKVCSLGWSASHIEAHETWSSWHNDAIQVWLCVTPAKHVQNILVIALYIVTKILRSIPALYAPVYVTAFSENVFEGFQFKIFRRASDYRSLVHIKSLSYVSWTPTLYIFKLENHTKQTIEYPILLLIWKIWWRASWIGVKDFLVVVVVVSQVDSSPHTLTERKKNVAEKGRLLVDWLVKGNRIAKQR